MYILIVEDDLSTAAAMMESMETWGHQVEISAIGKDALAKVTQKKFELVFLDIFLPDCKGHELIPRFKEIQRDMGIVTMTGYNSRELELEVRQQGIHYFLTKPVQRKTLKEIVDHISKKKRDVTTGP
jgi:DNA-binding NtrC family response regulator